MRSVASILLVAVAASPGCLTKAEAPPIRYFQPPLSPSQLDKGGANGPALMLRVEAAPHLGEPVVWQDDGVEVGFYADRRWISPPGRFLEDALSNELFGSRSFRPSIGQSGARLDVELLAFEEERRPGHAALVKVRAAYRAAGGDVVRLRDASARVELAADEPVELARALGLALERVAEEIGNWVEG